MEERFLIYDTETTGLPDWKNPSDAPQQPHLVQLGALMVGVQSRHIYQTIDLTVHPIEWQIGEDMTAIHGIPHELAFNIGIDEKVAVHLLFQLWSTCTYRVGFNEKFDARIMRCGLKRYFPNEADAFKEGNAECVMWMAKEVMGVSKHPKLVEAYYAWFGKFYEGAHTAMNDCMATLELFWAIKDGKQPIYMNDIPELPKKPLLNA